MSPLTCRFCATPLTQTFVDLGMSPLANAYLEPHQLAQTERFFPLHTYVCERCHLVQLPEVESPEAIFRDYAYFSSYSDTWLEHCETYAEAMCRRFSLGERSLVIEVASNDGYLLQYFQRRKVPVLGIEPARNVAAAAERIGIPTRVEFFGTELASLLVTEGCRANLVVANNVLAHTPHLNDFVAGLEQVLAPDGVITLEFPHLVRLVEGNQFDTIYHEHFSYFSFTTVSRVLAAHGLAIFDVEELSTHGGSLRVFASRPGRAPEPRVVELLQREERQGYLSLTPYRAFSEKVKATKRRLLEFLVRVKEEGQQVVGYGAPAKGNTLLNYCGLRTDFLDYTVDRSPHKQGRFLPGTHLPIVAPERIGETRPDYVFILPWNLRKEIIEQMQHVRQWGGKFVVAIPELEVIH